MKALLAIGSLSLVGAAVLVALAFSRDKNAAESRVRGRSEVATTSFGQRPR